CCFGLHMDRMSFFCESVSSEQLQRASFARIGVDSAAYQTSAGWEPDCRERSCISFRNLSFQLLSPAVSLSS
ncbi:unnamed protein product, partial [Mycena citricolor]